MQETNILISTINFQIFEESPCEMTLDITCNLKQIYQKFVNHIKEEIQQVIQYEFTQIILYLKSKPTKKLQPKIKIRDLKKELPQQDPLHFILLFPKENLPLISYQINDNYYYITQNQSQWMLKDIIRKMNQPYKTIVHNNQHKLLMINDKQVNYSIQKDQKFKNYSMQNIIHISIKLSKEENQRQNNSPNQANKQSLEQKKSEKPIVNAIQNITNQNKQKELKKQQIKQLKRQKKVEEKYQIKHQLKHYQVKHQVKHQIKQQIKHQIKHPNQLKKQDTFFLIINFQGNNGKNQLSFQTSINSTMKKALHTILPALRSHGFDIQQEFRQNQMQDIMDRINIIFQGSQFIKLQKKFNYLINIKNDKTMVFTIEKHYEGGLYNL